MSEKLGQEPAFPFVEEQMGAYGEKYYVVTVGMSKRFYAACAAMNAMIPLIASDKNIRVNGDKLTPESVARASYMYADELLKQENQ